MPPCSQRQAPIPGYPSKAKRLESFHPTQALAYKARDCHMPLTARIASPRVANYTSIDIS